MLSPRLLAAHLDGLVLAAIYAEAATASEGDHIDPASLAQRTGLHVDAVCHALWRLASGRAGVVRGEEARA